MKSLIEYIGFRLGMGMLEYVPTPMARGILHLSLRTLGYRAGVIDTNLLSALKKCSSSDLLKIKKDFYSNLAMVMTMQAKGSKHISIKYSNPELITTLAEKYGTVLLLGSHYGCWESVGKQLTPILAPLSQYVAYKKVKNPLINRHILGKRSDTRATPIEMSKIYREIIKNKAEQQATVYYLIADQYPSSLQDIRTAKLMELETRFVNGPEKIAMKMNVPVLFLDIKINSDTDYTVDIIPVYMPDESQKSGYIVSKYAHLLERQILRNPSHWLWSHKRWKNLEIYE